MTLRTAADEAAFDKKVEREFAGHRGLQDGRDFRWNCFRYRDEGSDFEEKFYTTFPDAPGSPSWWAEFDKRNEEMKSCGSH